MDATNTTVENTGYSIFEPPRYVGRWRLPGAYVFFYATQKRRWMTRFLMRHLMQWEWDDITALGEKE